MLRRDFLKMSALAGLSACSPHLPWQNAAYPVDVRMPGMQLGHMLRDRTPLPSPRGERQCEVAILGSGVAGLFAGWRLAQAGFRNFCLLEGPEPLGNAAGRELGGIPCPSGAHYLPLPSRESTHVREMLSAFGVLRGDPASEHPEYDETVLVNAPEERLLVDGVWQEGVVPWRHIDEPARQQISAFLAELARYRDTVGSDGRRAFVVPLALSSQDEVFRALDRETFGAWLTRRGYTAEALRWYLDYCCRDDYGAGIDAVSAWAGLHYFAARAGHAANAEDGTMLTWADGLRPVARRLHAAVGPGRSLRGMAVRVTERRKGVEVLCYDDERRETFLLKAQRVIVAMPLHVAMHVVEGFADFGFDRSRDLPPSASWLVTNFLLRRFPQERDPRQPLAWDNVIYRSGSLGWVVATNQWIRQAKPEKTVFTAYHALDERPAARSWLTTAGPAELLQLCHGDLRQAYGPDFDACVERAEITVRGHAMASPVPGFLNRGGIETLRSADGRILFAHADLSGLSVFEEAAWWGNRAAMRLISNS